MMKSVYKVTSKVFLWQGPAAWHFTHIPKKESQAIKETYGKRAKGWGSVPVEITLGKSTWKTSIFPDKRSGVYLLPLKIQIRRAEGIEAEDSVRFTMRIMA